MMEGGSVWQCGRRRDVVLRAVFMWLGATDLARAGAVSRAWRRAATDDSLWRHLLLQRGADTTLLRRQYHAHLSWRQEYVSTCTPWKRVARLAPAAAALQHAAFAPGARLLALVDVEASVTVWECGESWEEWLPAGSVDLRAWGWASAERVAWSEGGALLVAGELALVPHWELLVLRRGHDDAWHVSARTRCSPGAAGCWADAAGATFLSLELHLLAPRLAVTAVRLNSASQETHSEYAGVTVPLMLIFAEDGAHVAHTFVIDVPESETEGASIWDSDAEQTRETIGNLTSGRVMVASGGTWVGLWELGAPALPPPLLVGAPGELAERVRRRRQSRASPEREPLQPDEGAVRAACTPPARLVRLTAALEGLVPHPGGQCAWALTSDGAATCVSLPALCALRALGPRPRPAPPPGHYVQAGTTAALLARPGGAYSCLVHVWGVSSGARGAVLTHDAPALCALLTSGGVATGESGESNEDISPVLLVVAGTALHVWRSCATLQSPSE